MPLPSVTNVCFLMLVLLVVSSSSLLSLLVLGIAEGAILPIVRTFTLVVVVAAKRKSS